MVKHIIDTPLGWMMVEGDIEFIKKAYWIENDDIVVGQGTAQAKWKSSLEQQCRDYFEGQQKEFNLPLQAEGTAFQESVWQQLRSIPSGTTITYADLGGAENSRAVGSAVGANPILLFIPCHRVIGSDGKLHGYAAGIERKEALLSLEGALQNQQLRLF